MKTIYRYFEITAWENRTASTVVEYGSDFGYWMWENASNRHVINFKGQQWHVYSKLPITKATVEKLCLQLENPQVRRYPVDMKAASNLLSTPKSAMSNRKGRK